MRPELFRSRYPDTVDGLYFNLARLQGRIEEQASGCWYVVRGGLHRQGYGMVHVFDRTNRSHRMYTAHRLMYQIANPGRLRPNQDIIHLCNDGRCCRPDHLGAGSTSEMAQRAREHQRQEWAKLGITQVRQRRRAYKYTVEQMRAFRDWPITAVQARWPDIPAQDIRGITKAIREGRAYQWLDQEP